MPPRQIFTEDFKLAPFWWEASQPGQYGVQALPKQADVVVIGAGVTGVEAARALAAGGRHVLVLDRGEPGDGASTRNAGQIGRNFKHPYSELKSDYGIEIARGYFEELQQAYHAVEAIGQNQPEAIGWRPCGRVIGAMSADLRDKLHREYELRAKDLNETVEVIQADQIESEFGSRLYHGGIRLPNNGVVHPSLYHKFLLHRAIESGAKFAGHTDVLSVERDGNRFSVQTDRGKISSTEIIVATNGYTGKATPALSKRLLPITSYMVATEPLPVALIQSTLPKMRTYHDNRRRSHFFTVSNDGDRILMGARTGSLTANPTSLAARMHGDLTYIFPELEDVKLSHAWSGKCAAPVDLFPGFGKIDGIHYALGYCFSGLAMGPYLARKVASIIMGDEEAKDSLFHRSRFPIVPFPARGPWTLPVILGWYAWSDRPKEFTRRM